MNVHIYKLVKKYIRSNGFSKILDIEKFHLSRHVLKFIFENWNEFYNSLPEVSIYMDLNALTPNDIINKMTNEIATLKCWQSLDDDILKIANIISNARERYTESRKCLNQQKQMYNLNKGK